jgi:hypothetical protein
MTNPYRDMCAELTDALENARRIIDGADGTLHINTAEFVLRRARALLAQPVAEGPTDEELDAFIYGFFFEDDWYYNTEMERGLARAALAKWGHQ